MTGLTGFITIAVLVCQVNIVQKKSELYCYDKGSDNLRATEIVKYSDFQYYKCPGPGLKACNTEIKWDGCQFTLNNKNNYYSSSTCP